MQSTYCFQQQSTNIAQTRLFLETPEAVYFGRAPPPVPMEEQVLQELALVQCADGARRKIAECVDPADPLLLSILGADSSLAPSKELFFGEDSVLKVMRRAGMASLSDGPVQCRSVLCHGSCRTRRQNSCRARAS